MEGEGEGCESSGVRSVGMEGGEERLVGIELGKGREYRIRVEEVK